MTESSSFRTPLAGWHESHGGRMVEFAGWQMPVQYASIVEEHVATRTAAGMFDVSHMGRLAVSGPQAHYWLESLLTRRVADMDVGRVRYTLVTCADEPSAILDDALICREADAAAGGPRFSLVVNASNRERVVAWLHGRLPAAGVQLVDRTLETAMIAVQGPKAIDIVCGQCTAADAARIRTLRTYTATPAAVAGAAALVGRTGYTGEDGVEIVVAAADAVRVWEAVHAAGAPHGLRACGLGARDTLRLEAGMPLYGHELLPDSDPFAIGLDLAVQMTHADGSPRAFPGASRFRRLREAAAGRVRVGLVCAVKRPAREGAMVLRDGVEVGRVTSGSYCPTLGAAASMALVDREAALPGTAVDVLIRDAVQPARVVPLPFYLRPRG
ncbi:MAG: glycine cleavage system aminomethyltransferase GcvT [Planctomycetia bacterium]